MIASDSGGNLSDLASFVKAYPFPAAILELLPSKRQESPLRTPSVTSTSEPPSPSPDPPTPPRLSARDGYRSASHSASRQSHRSPRYEHSSTEPALANGRWSKSACTRFTVHCVNSAWDSATCGALDEATTSSLHFWLMNDANDELPLRLGKLEVDLVKTKTRSGLFVVTSSRTRPPPSCIHCSHQLAIPKSPNPQDASWAIRAHFPSASARMPWKLWPHCPSPKSQARFAAMDWAKTSLGPVETWPAAAITALRIMFSAPIMFNILLGDELVSIYNDAFDAIAFNHPYMWGQPASKLPAPLMEAHKSRAKLALEGHTVYKRHDLLVFQPDDRGRLIEQYLDWSYVPIYDSQLHRNVGILSPTVDTTDEVLTARRYNTMTQLIESLGPARTTPDFFQRVASSLEQNPTDLPFVLCYSVTSLDPHNARGQHELRLHASVGAPPGHPGAPTHLVAHTLLAGVASPGEEWLTCYDRDQWPFALALATRQGVLVDDCSEIVKGFDLRQWDELPDRAVVLPLVLDSGDRPRDTRSTPTGVLVIGINVRRPLDAQYTKWLQVLRGSVGASLDAVRALEDETTRRMERENLARARTQLVQGAAYAFKPPLTLIAGPLDDVLHSPLSSAQKEKLGLAQRNVWRLQQLVDSLLNFSRIGSGQLIPRFVAGNLGSFVAELAEVFRPTIDSRQLTFITDIDLDVAPVAFDPPLLEIVVSNLVTQSLQLTSTGTLSVQLHYEKAEHIKWAVITVKDTGDGVPDSYFQVLSRGFHHMSGTGAEVSLALASEIVRLHRGRLSVESFSPSDSLRFAFSPGDPEIPYPPATPSSSPGPGNTFIARFPVCKDVHLCQVAPDPIPLAGYSERAARDALDWGRVDNDVKELCSEILRDDTSNSSKSSPTGWAETLLFEQSDILLVVDNNPEVRSYVRGTFAPFCKVIEASDGEEALALATVNDPKQRPHLVLCELIMDKMNGHDLLAAMRANDNTRTMPFVFLSTCQHEETPATALVAGADDFILKPFRPREVIARVHLHMQMGKQRAELERKYLERTRELVITSDFCPVGIVRADANGVITYFNDAFIAPSGITREELAAKNNCWVDYVHPEDIENVVSQWAVCRSGHIARLPIKWRWKTGRSVSAIFMCLDMLSPNLTGVLGTVTDVTEAEERLHEAERRRIEAEESRRQQELLVDLTSHEIRTPVSAILQCSSVVKENLCELRDELRLTGPEGLNATPALLEEIEKDIEALESIYHCGLVQERIAGDILSLARIQLDLLDVCDVDFNLRTEIQRIFNVFTNEAHMNNTTMELHFGDSLDRMRIGGIRTDPVRFGQVVMNLVTNAMRFTSGATDKRITVTVETGWEPPKGYPAMTAQTVSIEKGGRRCGSVNSSQRGRSRSPKRPHAHAPLCVPYSPTATAAPLAGEEAPEDTRLYVYCSVSDTGPGMSIGEQELLFKRFQQGSKMTHTRYGGSGLGLFICKKITQLLGGDIEVESTEGEGTTFRFFIATRTAAPGWAKRAPAGRRFSHEPLSQLPSPELPKAPLMDLPRSPAAIPKVEALEVPGLSPPAYQVHAPLQGEGLYVLVVEDNIINQTVLKRQLCKVGFRCDVASDGEEALIKIAAAATRNGMLHAEGRGYDVVLMDVEMPIMDGITAVKTIRRNERLRREEDGGAAEEGGIVDPERPDARRREVVIALTGNARPGQIATARAAGFDHVLIKPYKFPSLVATMRSVVDDCRRGVSGGELCPVDGEEVKDDVYVTMR